jgi:hypothetical protein
MGCPEKSSAPCDIRSRNLGSENPHPLAPWSQCWQNRLLAGVHHGVEVKGESKLIDRLLIDCDHDARE